MKTNAALCLLAALLAVLAYRDAAGPRPAEERSPPTRGAAMGEPLLRLQRPRVTAIDVRDGRDCLVARATAPSGAAQSELAALADLLAGTRTIRRFPPAADWSAYGLDEPRMRIEVSQSGDERFQEIAIGDVAPTGTSVYARRDRGEEVLVVGRYFLQQLELAVPQLQERDLGTARPCTPDIVRSRVS